jgi:signal transduction histidine kinase
VPPDPARPALRRLLLAGVWPLAGVFFAGQYALQAAATGLPFSAETALQIALGWCTWAPFAFVVVGVARRLPLGGMPPARFVGLHLAACAAVSLAMLVPHELVRWGVAAAFRNAAFDPRADAWRLFVGLAGELVVYALIAAVAYAADAYDRARTREAEAARAELAAIRAHLNPHFLFNLLHALTGLVRADPARAEDALERFGGLLRYVLRLDRERREWVRLDEELAFARAYLDLEKLRLGDRLRVTWDVDDEAPDALVPPFVVQPLVENAVRHGLAPRLAGGALTVRARLDARDRLHVEVADDGVGADPAALDGEGFGLRSVRRRLAVAFGGAATVEVETALDRGFAVRLTLPARLLPAPSAPTAARPRLPHAHAEPA